jgi:hypothetical protein
MFSFAEFNKRANDLVNKDFPAEDVGKRETRRFEYRAKSANGTEVGFNASQRINDPQFDASLTLKKQCPWSNVQHEAEFKADTLKLTLTSIGKLHKDAKAIASVDVDPQTVGKDNVKLGGFVDLSYKHENQASVAAKFEQKKANGARDLTLGAVYNATNTVAVGGQLKLDTKPEKLDSFSELAFGVSHNTSDLVVAAVVVSTRNKVDTSARDNKLTIGAWQQFNSSTQFGGVAEVPLGQTGTPKLSAGVSKQLDNGENIKFRVVVPDGRVGASYAARLGSNATLSLSADVNVLKVREGVNDETLAFGVKFAVSSE